MRVAAFGRTHWLYDAIEAIAARGHEIVLIGTTTASPEYRRTEADFIALAAQLGCPVFVQAQLTDPLVMQQLAACQADVAISMNWPTLVSSAVRSHFRYGVLNGHPGDVPRFRGNACPNWAILTGEASVGLTVHLMADELDAGDVVRQEQIPLAPTDYIADVYREIDQRLPRLFAEAVDDLASGGCTPRPQSTDPADALRCYPRRPSDGRLDWRADAEALARLVRASAEPFAGAFTWLDGRLLRVWRARAIAPRGAVLGIPGQITSMARATGLVRVLCGAGELELELVEQDDAGRVPPAQLIRSTRTRLGLDVEDELAQLRQRVTALESLVAQLGAATPR